MLRPSFAAIVILRLMSKIIPILSIIAAFVAINLVSMRWSYEFDLTSSGVYSLSKESLEIAKAISNPTDIIFFSDEQNQEMRDASALLRKLANVSPNIHLRISDPRLEPSLAEMHQVRFSGTTIYQSLDRRVVTYGGTETEFVNGLIRVGQEGASRVCFADGHAESDPFSNQSHDHVEGDNSHSHSSGGKPLMIHERHGMGMAKTGLEVLGYLVEKRNLLNGRDPLSGCDLLVIASPQVSLLAKEVSIVREYLDDGLGVILLLEPNVDSGLVDLLADYGLSITVRQVSDPSLHYGTDEGTPAVSDYPSHEITRNLPLTFYPGVSSIEILETSESLQVVVSPLVISGPKAFVGERQERAQRILSAYVTKLDKGITKRLLVFGDGDFVTNSYFHILGNGKLFLNSVNSILGRTALYQLSPRGYNESKVVLTNRQMLLTFAVSTVVLPLLLSCFGLLFWWRGR